jgi:hypothetical protein
MTPTHPLVSHHRISPEQLAAADRAREYWAQRRVARDDAQEPSDAALDGARGEPGAGRGESPSPAAGQRAG